MAEPPREEAASRERDECAGSALFVDDRELRRRLNPRLGWDKFRAAVRVTERTLSPNGRVFPAIHPLWGGRYWPAVLAYLDDDSKVTDHDEATGAEDGQENFDAASRKGARSQGRQVPAGAGSAPALLVREERRPRHNGVSRRLHPVAGGR